MKARLHDKLMELPFVSVKGVRYIEMGAVEAFIDEMNTESTNGSESAMARRSGKPTDQPEASKRSE